MEIDRIEGRKDKDTDSRARQCEQEEHTGPRADVVFFFVTSIPTMQCQIFRMTPRKILDVSQVFLLGILEKIHFLCLFRAQKWF